MDVRGTRETSPGVGGARTTLARIVVGLAIGSVPLEVKSLFVLLLLYLDISLLEFEHMTIFGLDVLVGLACLHIFFIFIYSLSSFLNRFTIVFQLLRSHLVGEGVKVLALVVGLVP